MHRDWDEETNWEEYPKILTIQLHFLVLTIQYVYMYNTSLHRAQCTLYKYCYLFKEALNFFGEISFYIFSSNWLDFICSNFQHFLLECTQMTWTCCHKRRHCYLFIYQISWNGQWALQTMMFYKPNNSRSQWKRWDMHFCRYGQWLASTNNFFMHLVYVHHESN